METQSLDTTTYQHPFWLRTYHSNGFSFLFTSLEGGNSEGYLFQLDSPNIHPLKKENSILSTERSNFNMVNSVTYLSDNNIWMSSTIGCFNTLRGTPLFPNYISTKIMRDTEGNHWISTYNSGIIFIPNINLNQINQIGKGISKIKKINDSELLLGTIDGYIIIYNIQTKKITNSIFIGKSSTNPLFLIHENNELYVHDAESYFLDIRNNQIVSKKVQKLLLKNLSKINEDIILTQIGRNYVIIYDTEINENHIKSSITLSNQWETAQTLNNPLEKIIFPGLILKEKSLNIENIHYEVDEKRIWIAFTSKTSTEHQQTFKDFHNDDGKDLLLNCFADHMDEGVIAAKRNYGLVFIHGNRIISNTSDEKYESFGPIRKIITTDSLIISLAQEGIIISDKKGIPLYTLDETDGMKGSIINDINFHSNQLWIGTDKGLYNIHIDNFHDNLTAPKIHINNILINNEAINLSTTNFSSFPNNSDVEINYEAICFKGRKSFYYEYKLNNDEDWKTLSNSSSSIRFPNLSSGKYQFQIKAINEEGIKGNPAILNFKILPPFWLRWWFILGSIILIATTLFFYNKRNLERIEKENQLEQKRIERENKLEKERIERENKLQQEIRSNKLSALQSRMNPHFIFNSLNSIQDFIIRLDKEGANEYLGIFSDLMRIYLGHSEQDSIEIQEEIEALQLYLKLEELRFGDIVVDFHIDRELKNMDIHIPPLFIQPYIENAFKHGLLHKKEDRKLMIAFKLIDEQLIIHIEDNGVGRAKVKEIQNKTSAKGLSYSTKANQIRLELLNHNRTGKIKVNTIDLYKDATPSGTLVEIIIPILTS